MRRDRPATRGAKGANSARRLADCGWIVGAGCLLALTLQPFQNTPLIDDWTYAWAVERLMERGQLRTLDWNIHLNPVHVLWGWLFCLPAGFSFAALRLSTFTAALACVCGLYALLRELEVTRPRALLGAAMLGLNPIFFFLSISFMTDVPFLALAVWAAWAMVRALRERRDACLVAAAALAALALGVRQVGVVTPIAMAVVLLLHADDWGRRPRRVLLALLPLLLLAPLWWWKATGTVHVADLSGLKESPVTKLANTRYAFSLLPEMLVWDVAFAASALGVAMFPLAVGCVRRELLPRAAAIFAAAMTALAATVWWHDLAFSPPLSAGQTWAAGELGMTERLAAGATSWDPPAWTLWAGTAVATASFGIVAACWRWPRAGGDAFMAWMTLGLFLLAAVLWLYHDRYVLPLVPGAAALTLAGGPAIRKRAAVAAVAAFGAISWMGVRDHLAYNGALWKAVGIVRASGARPAEIDGGYVVNGWLQYAHPEDAARVDGRVAVPGVTDDFDTRYKVMSARLPGWKELHAVPFSRWLGYSGHVYVLEREEIDVTNTRARRTYGSCLWPMPAPGASARRSMKASAAAAALLAARR